MYKVPPSAALTAHIAEAHRLGLHADEVFHHECVLCVTAVLQVYRNECHAILTGLNDATPIAEFDAYFDRLTTDHDWSLLHNETVYTMAQFLGLPSAGIAGWDADPRWAALQAVATSIYQRRPDTWPL
jgi:hypothetical protein